MRFDYLNDENFLLFASKHYDNPQGITYEDFLEDLKRFKYIKRLCNRYIENNTLSERLLLNHLVIVFNVFGIEPAKRILELKLDEEHWPIIKPFLVYLKYIRNEEYTNISMNKFVIEALRKI